MPFPFLISCCSIALRNLPVFDAVERIARAGFPGVEILYPHIEQLDEAALRELKERCSSLGLAITMISPYFFFTRGREKAMESLRTAGKAIEAAHILGVKKIRTFIDCGPDGLPSSKAEDGHWQGARAGLKELCALDPAIEFAIETHENTLADTLPSVRRILEEVSAPNLALNYQANADFLQRGYLVCLASLFPAVTHMHWEQLMSDGAPTYIEETGVIDFAELIGFLRSRSYSGTASVEYCWTPVEEGRIDSAWRYLSKL